jgi:hypothetical protein
VKKLRTDAWEAQLSEDVRQQLYAYTKPPTKEEAEAGRPHLANFERDVLPWLSLQGIPAPQRSTWYRFVGRMEAQEREDRAARTIISVGTARKIAVGTAKAKIDPRLAADFLTALSVDAAAKQNEEAMKILADAASKYHAAALGAEKLKLDAARQRTADEQLKLAREKFEAAEKRLQAVADAADAMRGGKVDPEKVADEIDRILGRKK